MVGRAEHEDAVVALDAVHFVEEVGAHGVGDERVEVFEDEVAGGAAPGEGEDGVDAVFGAGEGGEAADVLWVGVLVRRWSLV